MNRTPFERDNPADAANEYQCAECGRKFQTPDQAISEEARTVFCSIECWTATKSVIPPAPPAPTKIRSENQ